MCKGVNHFFEAPLKLTSFLIYLLLFYYRVGKSKDLLYVTKEARPPKQNNRFPQVQAPVKLLQKVFPGKKKNFPSSLPKEEGNRLKTYGRKKKGI